MTVSQLDPVHVVRVSSAVSATNSARGPRTACSTTVSPGGGHTGATSTSGNAVGSGPTGRTSPVRNGGGPSPDSVSVLRDPSTGATSIPPRTAR